MSRTIDLGKVMVTLGGEWHEGSYEFLTVVSHKGNGYISRVDNTDIEPGTNDSVWMLFAAAGESPEITRDAKGNIYVNGELLTSAFADAEAAAARLKETDTAVRAAEQERKNVEAQRANAETLRSNAESRRQLAEDGRLSNESARINAENLRSSAETLRASAEALRANAENSRQGAELARKRDFDLLMENASIISEAADTIGELVSNMNEQKGMWKAGVGDGAAAQAKSGQMAVGDRSLASGSKLEKGSREIISDYSTIMYTPIATQTTFGVHLSGRVMSLSQPSVGSFTPMAGYVMEFVPSGERYTITAVSTRLDVTNVTVDRNFSEDLPDSGEIHVYKVGALGFASHVEGIGTVAYNEGEHAGGRFNVSNPGKTLFSIGCGVKTGGRISTLTRANAFEVTEDGKVYVKGVGGFDNGVLDDTDLSLAEVIEILVNAIVNLGGTVLLPSDPAEPVESESNP